MSRTTGDQIVDLDTLRRASLDTYETSIYGDAAHSILRYIGNAHAFEIVEDAGSGRIFADSYNMGGGTKMPTLGTSGMSNEAIAEQAETLADERQLPFDLEFTELFEDFGRSGQRSLFRVEAGAVTTGGLALFIQSRAYDQGHLRGSMRYAVDTLNVVAETADPLPLQPVQDGDFISIGSMQALGRKAGLSSRIRSDLVFKISSGLTHQIWNGNSDPRLRSTLMLDGAFDAVKGFTGDDLRLSVHSLKAMAESYGSRPTAVVPKFLRRVPKLWQAARKTDV